MRTLPLAVAGGLFAATASAQSFTFELEPGQEVPPVTTSSGTGSCTVTFDPDSNTVTVSGTYSDMTGTVTAAHIHGSAAPGATAGILVGLTVSGGTSGTISGSGTYGGALINDLLAGLQYVNVHSDAFPTGEIRGQIVQDPVVTAFGGNPADSLTVLGGLSEVGGVVTLGIDNPLDTQPVGAVAFLGISTAPDATYASTGVGTALGGWGMSGGSGELLIAVGGSNPILQLPGTAWGGAGFPAEVPISIPAAPELIGAQVFAQGVLVNTTGPGPVFGLTNGLELTFGS